MNKTGIYRISCHAAGCQPLVAHSARGAHSRYDTTQQSNDRMRTCDRRRCRGPRTQCSRVVVEHRVLCFGFGCVRVRRAEDGRWVSRCEQASSRRARDLPETGPQSGCPRSAGFPVFVASSQRQEGFSAPPRPFCVHWPLMAMTYRPGRSGKCGASVWRKIGAGVVVGLVVGT